MKFEDSKIRRFVTCVALAFSTSSVTPTTVHAQTAITQDVMVVFDMSGSMWGQVGGIAKVEIARDAFAGMLGGWRESSTRAGLIAYGHRRKGDCGDIELLAKPEDGANIASLVGGLTPRGKTPLSDAVRQAAQVLKFTEEAATVVLLSDGVETCDADPCAVGAELEALGLDFTAHVIGFDIAEGDKAQLQCLASATGGQYFDAADAIGLTEAMQGVVQSTAVEAPEELRGQDFQTVTLRVRMQSRVLSLPEEITIYGNDIVLGTLTEDTAVIPGLLIEMPFGPITLRAEGQGVSGEMIVDITNQTEIIDLSLTAADDNYVIWREGQLPVLEGGVEQLLMLKNTTGVDRAGFHRSYLYPSGSTDEGSRLKAGNLPPDAGIYVSVRVPSPDAPGDYDLVPTGTDGTEYGRIPLSFAAGIDPVWQGTREVVVGEVFDAFWAGSSNRRDLFLFIQDGRRVSRTIVDSMAQDAGFKLTAPNVAGIYDLVFESAHLNSSGSKITQLGQIAVGVPLPQDDASVVDPIAPNPDAIDFDTTDLKAETEAMGGEEGPLTEVGVLHGNWILMARNDAMNVPLARFQVLHEQGTDFAEGDFVIEAPDEWNLGLQGSVGASGLGIVDDNTRTLTFVSNTGTKTAELKRDGKVWRAPADMIAQHSDILLDVMVLRVEDLAEIDTSPVTSYFQAYDERGVLIADPVEWDLSLYSAEIYDQMRTANGLNSAKRVQGTYEVTATAGPLTGTNMITVSRSSRANNAIILRTDGEGDTLPFETAYYCSAGEDCDMFEPDYAVNFTLPEGWGAEKPLRLRSGETAFDMATMTAGGAFYARLNHPDRSANVGPCYNVMAGELCHANTDDPKLLADIETIRRGLSVQSVGEPLDKDSLNILLNKLTGAAE